MPIITNLAHVVLLWYYESEYKAKKKHNEQPKVMRLFVGNISPVSKKKCSVTVP